MKNEGSIIASVKIIGDEIVIVNGIGFDNKIAGPTRYAYEILKCIDQKCDKKWIIFIRKNQKLDWDFHNILYITSASDNKYICLLELIVLIYKYNAIHIDFTNGFAIGTNSIVTRHDLFAFYDIMGVNKWKIIKSRIRAIQSAHYAKRIVTVSKYTKEDIIKKIHVSPNKIIVIPNGWQHIIKNQIDEGILEKVGITNREYYLFVGRLVRNKNIGWIFKEADINPKEMFVIVGEIKKYENFEVYYGKHNNIIYTGYVSDGELATLYKNCKAFLFPSLMEGFGIPPMEALYYKKPIIISNISALPEIYEDTAHYINPCKYDYILNQLLKEPVSDGEKILIKYDWDKSSEMWISLVNELSTGKTRKRRMHIEK